MISVFKGSPPTPRYPSTWDVKPALTYLSSLHPVIQTDDENLCELQCVGTKAVSKTCVLGPFPSLSLVGMGKLGIRRPWERVGFCDVYETQRINGPRVTSAVYCSFLILKSRNQYYMYDFVTKHYIPPLMGCQPNKMRKEKKELKLQRMSIYI